MRVLRGAMLAAAMAAIAGAVTAEPLRGTATGDAIMALNRYTAWTQVSATRIGFDSFHAQGMVRIGDDIFVSSVEIVERTKPYPSPQGGFDRDQGRGQGWLFKMNAKGELLASLKLGEGAMYHAGGLDFDGRDLWLPVAEYRPGGPSILYRIDPKSMIATEALRAPDHIGAVVADTASRTLVGVNWGGRGFYAWRMDRSGRLRPATGGPTPNRAHYIGYQDCHSAGPRRMLCGGLANYRTRDGLPSAAIGGVELIDLSDFRPLWQAPVQAWTPAGVVMTSNAAFFEAVPGGVRGYFLPEDGRGTFYVYEARPPGR